jgi:hypothetical protein
LDPIFVELDFCLGWRYTGTMWLQVEFPVSVTKLREIGGLTTC